MPAKKTKPAPKPAPVVPATAPKKAAPAKRPAALKTTEPAAPPVVRESKAAKKPTAKARPKSASKAKPSDDVALRAYFIGEKRQAEGRAGDSHSDWVEAERQIAGEQTSARPKRSAKAK